jgi:hypothetical protein
MKSYEQIGLEIGRIVQEKNLAYGDSFAKSHKILQVLYPFGVKPEQFTDLLAVTRIIDKLFRIASDKKALGENPFSDIAGYGILGVYEGLKDEDNKR